MKRTFVVEVRRVDRWWAIDVPDFKGVHTQARRLAEVESQARDAIAAALDVPLRSVAVIVRPVLDTRISRLVDAARQSRIASQAAQIEAAQDTAAGLRALQSHGLSLRDAGALLGISHQRAAQLNGTDLRQRQAARRKAIAELRAGYALGRRG